MTAKKDAMLSAFLFCFGVLSTPASCFDEAVSASTTHFKSSFMLSEEILTFSINFFVWKNVTSSDSPLLLVLLRASKEQVDAIVLPKSEHSDKRKVEKNDNFKQKRERAKSVKPGELEHSVQR